MNETNSYNELIGRIMNDHHRKVYQIARKRPPRQKKVMVRSSSSRGFHLRTLSKDKEGAGPGSYDLPTSFGKDTFFYGNSTKCTIGNSSKTAQLYSYDIYKSICGKDSPGVCYYDPKHNLSSHTIKFGNSKARDLQFIEKYRDRSPGPIYEANNESASKLLNGSFGRAKRQTMISDRTYEKTPSPGYYDACKRSKQTCARIIGRKPEPYHIYIQREFINRSITPIKSDLNKSSSTRGGCITREKRSEIFSTLYFRA
jgi:hypothetical protein